MRPAPGLPVPAATTTHSRGRYRGDDDFERSFASLGLGAAFAQGPEPETTVKDGIPLGLSVQPNSFEFGKEMGLNEFIDIAHVLRGPWIEIDPDRLPVYCGRLCAGTHTVYRLEGEDKDYKGEVRLSDLLALMREHGPVGSRIEMEDLRWAYEERHGALIAEEGMAAAWDRMHEKGLIKREGSHAYCLED